MARRSTKPSSSHRSRGGNKKKSGSPNWLVAGIALIAVAVIGGAVWYFTHPDDYKFQRSHLDKYVESTQKTNLLDDGASVYVDMSDGMNFAYATPMSQVLLQSVINKLAGDNAIKFYGLADQKITPLALSHTQLYNYMLSPASYDKQKAPIEQTLNAILKNNQPALLMSDFEEYKGGVIEQAAYAKKYFIEWLAKGYNITFYKWDFNEHGIDKHMFLAVFDDNANRLTSLVDNAVKTVNPNIATYVLGGHDFAYPISTQYISMKDGGNYHNGKGQDVVTAVMSNGGTEDYFSYCKPYATASGVQGKFAPLNISVGSMAEYYPIGVKWQDAIANAKRMQEPGIAPKDVFTHLFRNLYVDFGAQSGYSIDAVEVRVFDMQETMKTMADIIASGKTVKVEELEAVNKPEINMVLTAGMQSENTLPDGWKEIFVDFDSQFNGTFMGGIPSSNLLRANIVISAATAKVNEALAFFGWTGNQSLANSVKETLTAGTSSPDGRILYTYYIKTVSE